MVKFFTRKSQYSAITTLAFGLLGIVILTLFSGTFTSAQSTPPIASYSFDDGTGTTLSDSSGNGYDGVFSDSPTWTTGKHAGALSYDGTDNVDLGGALPISGVNKLTLMAWVRRAASREMVEIGRQSLDTGDTIAIEAWNDGNVYFGVSGPGGYAGGYVPLDDTNWHHVVLVFDGTQSGNVARLKGYIDGFPQILSFEPGIVPSQTSNSATPFGLGMVKGAHSNGLIDDVRIYDRALSQAEIQADMNTPVGGSGAPAAIWQVDVSNADPGLDGSSPGYLFTALTANSDYVYTARGQNGSWNSPSCSLQRWNASDGSLVTATTPNTSCSGIYDLELKIYNGDGLGLVRLYAYRQGDVEIRDKTTFALIATVSPDATAPSCANPCPHTAPGIGSGSATKLAVARADGLNINAEHSDNMPNPGTYGGINPLNLFIGASTITLPTWITDVPPAPTTNEPWLYFGAEAVALSPAGDFVYIAGGNKAGGVLSSRIEKRALPTPPDTTVSITSMPGQVDNSGGTVTISWSSLYADHCDISSSPSAWSGSNLPPSGSEAGIGINPPATPVTFTATCTRVSDGMTGSDFVVVDTTPNQPPSAVIVAPATDIAINSGDTVSFDAGSCPTGSCDFDGNNIMVYEWREGDCTTGTLLSSAGTFSKNDFTLGTHDIYLSVKDDEDAWSACALRTITLPPKCSNDTFVANPDDDNDGLVDEADPGCWTDPANPSTYDGYDNDESNCGNNICEKNAGENFNTCRSDCPIRFYEN